MITMITMITRSSLTAALVALALATTVVAQEDAEDFAPRPMVRPPAGMQDALQPDYTPQDLPTFVRVLRLDDGQKLIIEALFDDYREDFDAGVLEVRERLAALRPSTSPADDRRQDEMRERMRELRDEARERSAATTDPEERKAIMEEYREAIKQLQEEMQGERAESSDPAVDYAETMAAMAEEIARWEATKESLRVRLDEELRDVLDEEQAERWPILERELRRKKTMHRGTLSAESIDLVELVETLDLDEATMTSLATALEGYAVEIDQALRRRNDYERESRQAQVDAMQAQDWDRLTELTKHELDLREAVRDVNERYVLQLRSELPEAAAAELAASYDHKAFPRIYRPTRAERLFESALRVRGLTAEARTAIEGLQPQLAEQIAVANADLRAVTIQHEAEQELAKANRLRSGDDEDDPIRRAFVRRRDVETAFVEQLKTLLTPEQFAALPGSGER